MIKISKWNAAKSFANHCVVIISYLSNIIQCFQQSTEILPYNNWRLAKFDKNWSFYALEL